MKRILFLTVLTLAAVAAFAFPGFEPVYFPAEVKAIGADLGSRTLGDLKISELVPIAERLDVARQKDGFVMMAGGLSLAWPGAGHFLAGDWMDGTLYTGLHLGVSIASLAWAHSLLPSDLQLSNLDYLAASHGTVQNRWNNHSLNDYLTAIGALAVGGAVDFALRVWSAKTAQAVAKTRIDDGKITFEPRFEGGRLGMGLGMGLRY
jgi:hypothetical protein